MNSSVPPGRTWRRRSGPRRASPSGARRGRDAPRRSPSRPAASSTACPAVTITWSIGASRPAKNPSRAVRSLASKVAVLRAPTSAAALSSRSRVRPVRITSAPSARARLAVSSPIPALPPITTTVCPAARLARRRRRVVTRSPSRRPVRGPGATSSRERLQRADVDLRERRERLDGVAQDVERDVRADGQRGLLHPLARLRAEARGHRSAAARR